MPGIAMIIDDTAVLETSGAGNFLNEVVMWETKMGLASAKGRNKHIGMGLKDLVTGKPFSPGTNEIVFDLTGPGTRVSLLENKSMPYAP